MKKVVAFLLAACLCFSFAACTTEKASVDSTDVVATPAVTAEEIAQATEEQVGDLAGKKIGMSVLTLQAEFFVTLTDGLRKIFEENGAELVLASYDMDSAKSVEIMENFIVADVDVIITMLMDESQDAVIDEAIAAGIPVQVAGAISEHGTVCVINDNTDIGQKIAEAANDYINNKLGGEAHVLFLTTTEGNTANLERSNAMVNHFKEICGEKVVIAGEQMYSKTGDGISIVENYLLKDPDINVVISYTDSAAIEAGEALKGAGKSADTCATFGCDTTDQALEQIRNGGMMKGSVYLGDLPLEMYNCVVAMLKGEVEQGSKWILDQVAITADNINEYFPQ